MATVGKPEHTIDEATKKVEHFTVAERAARGKAERAEVPRSSHADWERPANRRDPVELLEEQGETRVPELVPIRYGRMLTSPFAFYRGGAYLMAADLAAVPRTGLRTQLCGDAHLSNFGAFAAPDRKLVLDINDFDETLPGPFEWDVKRLATSFAVGGRDRGFDDATRKSIVLASVRAYRESMARCAAMRNMDLWYARKRSRSCSPTRQPGDGGPAKARREERRQGTGKGQRARLRKAHRGRRRRAAHHQRSAADRADRGAHGGGGRLRVRGARPERHPLVSANVAARPAQAARAVPVRRTRHARSSASAASAPGRGSCCCSAATSRTRSSCR